MFRKKQDIKLTTNPFFIDTPVVIASELVGFAGLGWRARVNCRVFIGAIDTVWIAVADPSFRNTLCATPVLVGHASELAVGIALACITLMTNIFI